MAVIAAVWLWNRFQPAAVPQANTPPPCRITLAAEDHPRWKGEKFMERYAEHFRALGFQLVGAYRIPELDNQRILAMMQPRDRFYACVYDSKTSPTFEIFATFSTDNALIGTNSTWVRDIEQRHGSVTLRVGNGTPAQVLEALKQHEKAADRVAINADGFVGAFLKSYVENYNWRLKKGEPGRDQIRMDARHEGQVLAPDQVEDLYRAKRAAYVAQLQDACRAQYRDQQKLDPADWRRLQNRLVAVPETYDLKEVINAISYATPAPLNEKQLFTLQRTETSLGDDGIIILNNIITKKVADLHLRQIGEVTEPVRAWIVAAEDAAPVPETVPSPVEQKAAA